MKWKLKPDNEFRPKFAFFPVTIKDVRIWLEWFDETGWYYDPVKCPDDLIKSQRYPSRKSPNTP